MKLPKLAPSVNWQPNHQPGGLKGGIRPSFSESICCCPGDKKKPCPTSPNPRCRQIALGGDCTNLDGPWHECGPEACH